MNRNYSIDLLKCLSCFAVVCLHVAGMIVTQYFEQYTISHFIYYLASFAIPIFFMVNGYLLLSKKEMSYQYAFLKILKMIKVVLLWNIFFAFLFLIIKNSIYNPLIMSVDNLLQRGILFQFWFFGALSIIYIILPILYKIFNKNDKIAILLSMFFIILCTGIDIVNFIRISEGSNLIQENVIQTFRLWTWLAYFTLGGMFSKKNITDKIYNKVPMSSNGIILLILCFICPIYEYFVSNYFYHTIAAEYFYDSILMFLWTSSMFIFINRLNIKYGKLLKIISDNMIGIFILHILIKKMVFKININTPVLNSLSILIVFIISLFISDIIRKIPLIKNWIKMY